MQNSISMKEQAHPCSITEAKIWKFSRMKSWRSGRSGCGIKNDVNNTCVELSRALKSWTMCGLKLVQFESRCKKEARRRQIQNQDLKMTRMSIPRTLRVPKLIAVMVGDFFYQKRRKKSVSDSQWNFICKNVPTRRCSLLPFHACRMGVEGVCNVTISSQ